MTNNFYEVLFTREMVNHPIQGCVLGLMRLLCVCIYSMMVFWPA